jgi:drug/metabolite transporter (DMT)-like permease
MSLVAPISATGAALPAVVGVAAGDRPSLTQGVGLIVAVAGVVVAARPAGGSAGKVGHRRGVPLAVLAALGIGCFLLGAHVGARGGVLWFLLLSRAAGALPLAALLARAARDALPRLGQLPPLLVVAGLDGSATALLAVANRHGVVSIVSVVSSLYPVVTVLLARALLAERLAPSQAAGVAGALAGVALISAG